MQNLGRAEAATLPSASGRACPAALEKRSGAADQSRLMVVAGEKQNKQRQSSAVGEANAQLLETKCPRAGGFIPPGQARRLAIGLKPRLQPNAANAVGAHHVDLVVNKVDPRHMADCLLNELLEIKTRQPAGQVEVSTLMFDAYAATSPTKMRMTFQMLPRHRT
jgi:hypothetical protein